MTRGRVSIDAGELDEIEDRNASLQTRLYRAQKERDKAVADNCALREQLAAWQTVSGLVGGSGDPSDVTPEQLERYIGQLTRVAEAAKALMQWDWTRHLDDSRNADDARADSARLGEAVDALPREAP